MTPRLDIALSAEPGGRAPFDLLSADGRVLGRCEAVRHNPQGRAVSGWTTARTVALQDAAGVYPGRVGAPHAGAQAAGHAGARMFQVAAPAGEPRGWLVLSADADGDGAEALFLVAMGRR
ncbi:hypothetical protein [Paracoccus luteus]|uniref:hypothetical protein n=1 Tax=Paracoccus luteus TaxID=2508543 RepID=UPI001070312C|nr:hypothetical protein [Paracoccus luteus]